MGAPVRYTRVHQLPPCSGILHKRRTSTRTFNLWKDQDALDVFVLHWTHFASRYRHVLPTELSFNLINEPARCEVSEYARVVQQTIESIRAVDPRRPLLVDGMFGVAILPVTTFDAWRSVIHATRGYTPFHLSHYRAPWANTPSTMPTWPLSTDTGFKWDRQQLYRWCVYPWDEIVRAGVQVFVGEWGCWNQTPHDAALCWMRDNLTLWRQAQWGWALWTFRGSFGIFNNGRSDVHQETWRGGRLDRSMLALLQEFQ